MARLIRPEKEELAFRRKLYESKSTMRQLGGPVPFPKEMWDEFYRDNVQTDPEKVCYRLIFCGGCNDFVGEAYYRRLGDTDTAECGVLIDASRRMSGYGRSGITLLEKEAFRHGIRRMTAYVPAESGGAGFLKHMGYIPAEETDRNVRFEKKIGE